jgi:hypothetical protein
MADFQIKRGLISGLCGLLENFKGPLKFNDNVKNFKARTIDTVFSLHKSCFKV